MVGRATCVVALSTYLRGALPHLRGGAGHLRGDECSCDVAGICECRLYIALYGESDICTMNVYIYVHIYKYIFIWIDRYTLDIVCINIYILIYDLYIYIT